MKIDRLFAITNILIDKRTVTATELAQRFGVSVRTIYRDIEILSTNGVPIYTLQGKGGGISIMDGYSMDKTVLSDAEQKQVLMALQSIKATGSIDVDDSIHKLRNVFKKDMTNWIEIDFSGWEQSNVEKQIFEIIKDGILNSTIVSFSYFGNSGEKTERIVEPLKLVFKGTSWYLYGYCRMRKDYRFFKLRRMDNLAAVDGDVVRMTAPVQIAKAYEKKNVKEEVKLTLKINSSMAFRIYDEFRNGSIKKSGDYFIVEVTMPKGPWLYSYLLGFGATLEVIEPMEVRNNFKDELRIIIGKYL